MEDLIKILDNQKLSAYTVQEQTHQERKHLVVPVVMIVEGVLSGSQGPLLHLASDFGKIPESWNGIPVVINHPEVNGVSVSANSPEIIDTQTVGRIYNAHLDGVRLVAEAWLDEEKLTNVSTETAAAVNASEPIEVSVGVFTENEAIGGTYNDVKYNAVARNHRPDHLALLPGGVGACSLEDGCGVRVNNNEKKGEQNEMIVLTTEQLDQHRTMRYSIRDLAVNSSDGLKEKLDKLRSLVGSLDVQGDSNTGSGWVSNYLEEAYDSYLIYEQYSGGKEKYYKQGYQIDAAGTASFVGEPIVVEKKIEFEVVNNLNVNAKMEKCAPCIEKRVNALVDNKSTNFTETDREWLQTLSEEQLDRMIPVETPAPAVQTLSKDEKAALEYGKKLLAQRKADMTATITANTAEGVWPAEVLANMDDDMLERVYNSVKKEEVVVDYSLNRGTTRPTVNAVKEEPLLPTGVVLKQV